MKPTALPILLALLALSFLGCNRLSEESGYLVIDAEQLDPALLPYRLEQVYEHPYPSIPMDVVRHSNFVRVVPFGPLTGYIFTGIDSSQFLPRSQHNIFVDLRFKRPLPMPFDADGDGADEIALAYSFEDSLFIEVVHPVDDLLARRLLYIGKDANHDGFAEIGGYLCADLDVDGNGCRELLLQITSGYDKWPRAILLYDWHADSVRWAKDIPCGTVGLPVALPIQHSPRPDTVIGLVTSSVCNGHNVGPWDDCHSYLLCFGLGGELRWYKTLGGQHANCQAVAVTATDSSARIIANRVADSTEGTPDLLCAFDLDGNLRESLVLQAPLYRLACFTEPDGTRPLVIASLEDNTALLLSGDLRILHRLRSPARILPLHYADILNLGRPQILLLMANRWLLALDTDMRPLAHLDRAVDCSPLAAPDSDARLLVRRDDKSVFFAPRPNSPLMVLLLRYRMELLFLAGILASALVVTLFFQRRTRRNLDQIRLQKTELERIHHELQTTQQKLIEAEKYKQAKDIAGAFAHEIRNALFPARFALNRLGKADLAQADAAVEIPARVHDLNRAVTRAIDLTTLISRYTKLESEYKPEICHLAEAIASAVNDLSAPLCDRGIAVTTDGPADTTVRFGRLHLGIVLTNLLRNSLDALAGQPGSAIDLRWSVANNTVLLTLTDNGPGIPPELRGRIFDAFFTTKPDTGTGLGLATVRRLVDMYNGTVTIEEAAPRGCRFLLSLQSANPGTGD